ncbi:Hypothetical predicted protein [Paramuricea clavata]|uniref:Uncharacterized protein n=1 Tax=Paramuricea clavata TaxID=317549 RepID=A0A6S7J118_PARCT|nr:Hypothetical predicted protein [Paramuricea clavata]
MIKSRAELFAEINVTPPLRTVSQLKGKTIHWKEKLKLVKRKINFRQKNHAKRKTKKKSDANKENRPAVKDKLATVIGVGKAPQPSISPVGNIPSPSDITINTKCHQQYPRSSKYCSSKDLAPLTMTPSSSNTPCDEQNIALDLVSNDELAAIKLKRSGPTAFASVLFRTLFTLDEMRGRNCRGLVKKEKLDEGQTQQNTEVCVQILSGHA